MDFETFCQTVDEIYSELPKDIQDKTTVLIEETPEINDGKIIFGYWSNLTPGLYTLCYWGFKATNDFRREHIERVMKHEFEHVLFGLQHSEHK